MGGPTTVDWRGVRVDPRTGKMLDEVGRLTPSLPTLIAVQGSYNTSVSASAGTHAGGGAIDISVRNLTSSQKIETVRVMRIVGFAAWRRLASEGPWGEHIHGIAVGQPDLSPAAANQVTSLRSGRNGLKNNALDPHRNLGLPVVSWEQYLRSQEDDMPAPRDWTKADWDAFHENVGFARWNPTSDKQYGTLIRRGGQPSPSPISGNSTYPDTKIFYAQKEATAARREGQKANAKLDAVLEVVAAIDGVDADALAAKVAAEVERLDAEAVAEQLEVTVRE